VRSALHKAPRYVVFSTPSSLSGPNILQHPILRHPQPVFLPLSLLPSPENVFYPKDGGTKRRHRFPQSPQGYSGVLPRLGHGRLLPNNFQSFMNKPTITHCSLRCKTTNRKTIVCMYAFVISCCNYIMHLIILITHLCVSNELTV
jgi:hypothetical protein